MKRDQASNKTCIAKCARNNLLCPKWNFLCLRKRPDVSWPSHFNNHLGIWEHLLKLILDTETLNRTQKRPNIVLICKFFQPYSILWSFLTRFKIMWVDCHVPTIILVHVKNKNFEPTEASQKTKYGDKL